MKNLFWGHLGSTLKSGFLARTAWAHHSSTWTSKSGNWWANHPKDREKSIYPQSSCCFCHNAHIPDPVLYPVPDSCSTVPTTVHCVYWLLDLSNAFLFLNPHLRICLLILEKEEGGERMSEKETLMWERSIDRSPPICAPTRGWTHILSLGPDRELNPQTFGVWDDTPTKPPGQGSDVLTYLLFFWYWQN